MCQVCKRERPCTKLRGLQPICDSCRPPRLSTCAYCGRDDQRTAAMWPLGPACPRCYGNLRDTPRRCPSCGQTRALIGADQHGDPAVCGPCVGFATDFGCTTCGVDCVARGQGRCARCVLVAELDRLPHMGIGNTHPQLATLKQALLAVDKPVVALRWIRSGTGSRLLGELAPVNPLISHQLLDTLPQDMALRRLRNSLVHVGALPARDEVRAQLELWVERQLAAEPADRGQILRSYAQWWVLRRARARTTHTPMTDGAAGKTKQRITSARALLTWLDNTTTTLADLSQPQLDTWLADQPRYIARHTEVFINWAHRQRLTTTATVPAQPSGGHIPPLAEDERWTQLGRCLRDEALPADLRLAGALVLMFAQPVSRLVTLRTADVRTNASTTELVLHSHPVRLPPAIADLLHSQVTAATTASPIGRSHPAAEQWLFPGREPGKPHSAHGLTRRLNRHGLSVQPAKGAALIDLASDLPSPLLADLLGLSIQTAVKWAQLSQRDWTTYLHQRADADPASDGRETAR